MKKQYIPLRNTIINSVGTFISRVTGIAKFNIVNYFFGAGADTFYSANANILSLRKIFGEGPLVNAFIPIYTKEKKDNPAEAHRFASNIINQIVVISFIVSLLGTLVTPWWTRTFLPGFNDDPLLFSEIVLLTSIMLFSTVFFSVFSVAMGLLNAHERFISSSTGPIMANLIFIIFPIFTHKQLGIASLAWGFVAGSLAQALVEGVELIMMKFKYTFYLNFFDSRSKEFWRLFVPIALNYLAQTGISIGLGYFSSFLPRGSITYLRNANTIMIAPVGFIGVAISGAIFPTFSRVKHDLEQLSEAWVQGLIFFLFVSIPIAGFFYFYSDVIVNLVFRDISRLFSNGSTGKFTDDLQLQTANAIKILSTILIPWSLNIMISKLFYSLEKPRIPLYLFFINFTLNIVGYKISQIYNFGGVGLLYSDLIAGWSSLIVSLIIVALYLPIIKNYNKIFVKYILLFALFTVLSWQVLLPLYQWYLGLINPLLLLFVGSILFLLGLGIFFGLCSLFKVNPLRKHELI